LPGNLLREQYDDLRRHIDAMNVEQMSVCSDYIKLNRGPVCDGYTLASDGDRERIVKEIREVCRQLWSAGNEPQAMALGVILLNVESQFASGDEAAFVKTATDDLINRGID
jgi:hypothetical protein